MRGAEPEPEASTLQISADELRQMVAEEEERREVIRAFVAANLKVGVDYGTIITGKQKSKPSLWKPGAEKVCSLLQLRPAFAPDQATQAMAGNSPGLFAYVCWLVNQDGRVVGEGRGAAELGERRGWTANNAIKMAEKRSQVDAVLRVAGLSELFTQDLEDAEQRTALEMDTGPWFGSAGKVGE